jgi:5-methylthioribose kinase
LFELEVSNAIEYLRGWGFRKPAAVSELGGGVSNTVLLVQTGNLRLVLKQALGKLRVERDWFSDRARIFRESAVLRAAEPLLPPGSVPRVLFEDRENYLFAMTAAPEYTCTWKQQLLQGVFLEHIPDRIGLMLGTLFRETWGGGEWEREFGDQTVFDQLRLDPYYRATAEAHPDLAPNFARLMETTAKRRCSLVHGDWSPKNFLVSADSVMAIDFEVVHFGDPAFDAAFLLNHLVLKSMFLPKWKREYGELARRFWKSLLAAMPAAEWFEPAVIEHLGCLLLARIDGKSPAEYVRTPELRAQIRERARRMIMHPPDSVEEVFE